jgi:hypothetical protein
MAGGKILDRTINLIPGQLYRFTIKATWSFATDFGDNDNEIKMGGNMGLPKYFSNSQDGITILDGSGADVSANVYAQKDADCLNFVPKAKSVINTTDDHKAKLDTPGHKLTYKINLNGRVLSGLSFTTVENNKINKNIDDIIILVPILSLLSNINIIKPNININNNILVGNIIRNLYGLFLYIVPQVMSVE